MSIRRWLPVLAMLSALLAFAAPRLARAEATPPTDCPPGSVGKASGEYAWCEPTVCENDAQCSPGQLCRPVKLCLEIGKVTSDAGPKLGAGGGAADKLVATGMCVGAEKACPANTTCSDKKRCLDRAAAQKLNLLDEPKPVPSAGGTAEPVKKSSCGCRVAGGGAGGGAALLAACALGLAIARRRTRA